MVMVVMMSYIEGVDGDGDDGSDDGVEGDNDVIH